MTIKELYEYGLSNLAPDEKNTETVFLLEEALGTDRKYLFSSNETEVCEEQIQKFFEYIERRKNGEPVQYIVNKAYFYKFEFFVQKGVLIPRFDTENLVEKVLQYVKKGDRVLDVCTGSGCILLSVMAETEGIEGTGSDIEDIALKTAEINSERMGIKANFVKSNLFENITGEFDVIISNPPYIEREVIASLESQVREYEPFVALDGGEDGLDFYRRISKDALKHLKKGGRLFFEIGYNQGESVPRILEKDGYTDIRVSKDLCGNDRVVSAIR